MRFIQGMMARAPEVASREDALSEFPLYRALAAEGYLTISDERSLTGAFTGWGDFYQLTQRGVQRTASISVTEKGRENGELRSVGQIEVAFFSIGSAQIEEIVANDTLTIGADRYRVVLGTHTFEPVPWLREALREARNDTLPRERRFKALLKYDAFSKTWGYLVSDIGSRAVGFATSEVDQAIAFLRLGGTLNPATAVTGGSPKSPDDEETTPRAPADIGQTRTSAPEVRSEPVDPFPETPLGAAARAGNVSRVRELLRAGASPNESYGYKRSHTPLMAAAKNGHLEATRVLIQAGARHDQSAEGSGLTALGMAAEAGHVAVIDLLVSVGASLQGGGGNHDPVPPLQAAAGAGQVEAVRALLRAGASPNEKQLGSTAIDAARAAGHAGVVTILQNALSTSSSNTQSVPSPVAAPPTAPQSGANRPLPSATQDPDLLELVRAERRRAQLQRQLTETPDEESRRGLQLRVNALDQRIATLKEQRRSP
ncbi:MAG: ankyrin repeat domain-containing protein [Gemmatimonadaceae bacterium]